MARKPLDYLQNVFFGKISRSEWVNDVCDHVFTEWRVVPEDLVPLSVLSLVCRGRFILEGVLITLSSSAFWYGCAAWSNEGLSDERCERRLLIPAGMFFL